MKRANLAGVTAVATFLQACSAVGVIESSDPHKKISDAIYLISYENRPLPAEKLIRQAIGICEEQLDQGCLADAYMAYSYFFRSDSVTSWGHIYRENGFLDKSALFEARIKKSNEYMQKALPLMEYSIQFDAQTNAFLYYGLDLERAGNNKKACQMYAQSLAAYKKNIEANPDAKIFLPKKYKNYDEFIQQQRGRAGCSRD